MDDLESQGGRRLVVKVTPLAGALLLAAVVAASCSAPRESAAPTAPGSKPAPDASEVSFSDDFDTDPARRWEPITPAAWRWDKDAGNYELAENVPLDESVRAPFNRNLAKGVVVGDFQLDVDL